VSLGFTAHLQELVSRVLKSLAALLIGFAFSFLIEIKPFDPNWLPFGLYYPYPDPFNSITVQLIKNFESRFLYNFKLINVNAYDTVYATLYVSFLVGLMISMPYILYQVSAFVSPALTRSEKRVAAKMIFPATAMFLAGVLFGYFYIIPLAFRVLYLFVVSLGVQPTLSIGSFVSLILLYMLGFGIGFELPVAMVALSSLGIVSPNQWTRYWRYGVMLSFVIALIISPGTGGGVNETIIGLSLSALYGAGALVSRLVFPKRAGVSP
jgi:sec-independent protein translocase protein TatC